MWVPVVTSSSVVLFVLQRNPHCIDSKIIQRSVNPFNFHASLIANCMGLCLTWLVITKYKIFGLGVKLKIVKLEIHEKEIFQDLYK